MELKIPLLHPNPHQLDCLTHNFHTIILELVSKLTNPLKSLLFLPVIISIF